MPTWAPCHFIYTQQQQQSLRPSCSTHCRVTVEAWCSTGLFEKLQSSLCTAHEQSLAKVRVDIMQNVNFDWWAFGSRGTLCMQAVIVLYSWCKTWTLHISSLLYYTTALYTNSIDRVNNCTATFRQYFVPGVKFELQLQRHQSTLQTVLMQMLFRQTWYTRYTILELSHRAKGLLTLQRFWRSHTVSADAVVLFPHTVTDAKLVDHNAAGFPDCWLLLIGVRPTLWTYQLCPATRHSNQKQPIS